MNSKNSLQKLFQKAADYIIQADSLVITAGAGMGVDSGLPDFRGQEGFWKAYPALGNKDLSFTDIASPYAFKDHPKQAWGFYGHRLNLYRETRPHDGFKWLKEIGESLSGGYFVYTSNVDGQFQKAGFDRNKIVEVHGSIHHLQCIKPCTEFVFSAQDLYLETNDAECLLISEIPHCKDCGEILRPNILMFDDWGWIHNRTFIQKKRYETWLKNNPKRVIIEIGAGMTVPSIRLHSNNLEGTLIRINPREPEIDKQEGVSIATGGLEAIQGIYACLLNSGFKISQLGTSPLVKIVSGGQTGVDRAALDAALENDHPCGGWCPDGRKAEDGVIPEKYPLVEMKNSGYRQRTKKNVVDSDGTLIVYFKYITGGTELTLKFCITEKKPYLLIDGDELTEKRASEKIRAFVHDLSISKLNVAGPRGSGDPRAYSYTKNIISQFLQY